MQVWEFIGRNEKEGQGITGSKGGRGVGLFKNVSEEGPCKLRSRGTEGHILCESERNTKQRWHVPRSQATECSPFEELKKDQSLHTALINIY